MAPVASASPFIRKLAANDRATREKALNALRDYLGGRAASHQLSRLEFLKLWKGLFYCMWHSDRPRTQQRLARDLAELVDIMPMAQAIRFCDAFWVTIAREWGGIDVLRMDKFLFLVRQYLFTSFRMFAKDSWKDTDLLEEYMNALAGTPFDPRDPKIPNGLRYHVLDIYVDELDKLDAARAGKIPMDILLRPVRALEKESPLKSVRKRAQEVLADERLKDWNKFEQNEGCSDVNGQGDDKEVDVEWSGFDV